LASGEGCRFESFSSTRMGFVRSSVVTGSLSEQPTHTVRNVATNEMNGRFRMFCSPNGKFGRRRPSTERKTLANEKIIQPQPAWNEEGRRLRFGCRNFAAKLCWTATCYSIPTALRMVFKSHVFRGGFVQAGASSASTKKFCAIAAVYQSGGQPSENSKQKASES